MLPNKESHLKYVSFFLLLLLYYYYRYYYHYYYYSTAFYSIALVLSFSLNPFTPQIYIFSFFLSFFYFYFLSLYIYLLFLLLLLLLFMFMCYLRVQALLRNELLLFCTFCICILELFYFCIAEL